MLTFTEAQILGWVTPILWPFIRVLALFSAMPVIAQVGVPARVRIALAFLVAFCAQATIPEIAPIELASAAGVMAIAQQVLIALPFKLMLFVLADGWNLLIGSLAASFVT